MVEERTPAFCGVCGTRLTETRLSSVTGYDIYTGEPLSNETVIRSCPNPTITNARFGRVTTTSHRSYRFDGDGWV